MPKRMLGRLLLLTVLAAAWTGAAWAMPVNFVAPSLDGGVLRLSAFRGRVVLVEFFDSTCRVCKQTMPKLQRLADLYSDQGLSVIGFSVDKHGAMAVRPFVAKLGVRFPVALGDVDRARRLDPIQGLPTLLVIDPKGNIVKRFLGYTSTQRVLAAVRPYLSRSAPPAPVLAKVKRGSRATARFGNVYVYNNQRVMGKPGSVLSVEVDMADLEPMLGLWLAVHLRPSSRMSTGLVRQPGEKVLYHRVDDVSRKSQVIFIGCDQFPVGSASGAYRGWMQVLDNDRRVMDRSAEFLLHPRACFPARTR